jgi:hypothetical protein
MARGDNAVSLLAWPIHTSSTAAGPPDRRNVIGDQQL